MDQALIDAIISQARVRLQCLVKLSESRGRDFGVGALILATVDAYGAPLGSPLAVSLHPLCGAGGNDGVALDASQFHELMVSVADESEAIAVVVGYGQRHALRHRSEQACVVVETFGDRHVYDLDGSELVNDLSWSPVLQLNINAN